jgi:hypothetical protein
VVVSAVSPVAAAARAADSDEGLGEEEDLLAEDEAVRKEGLISS